MGELGGFLMFGWVAGALVVGALGLVWWGLGWMVWDRGRWGMRTRGLKILRGVVAYALVSLVAVLLYAWGCS